MAKPRSISTVASIKNLPRPKSGQSDHSDKRTPGLFIRVTPGGTKSFVVFYRWQGNQRRDTIGRFVAEAKEGDRGSLKWARDQADHIRNLAAHGIDDPRIKRQEERDDAKRKQDDTYKTAVEAYISERRKGDRKLATAGEIQRALLKFGAESKWLNRPVSKLGATEIYERLNAVRDGDDKMPGRPILANRLFAYLGPFFDWCANPGVGKIKVSPMVGLKKPLKEEEPNQRVFENSEIKALWTAADALAHGNTKKNETPEPYAAAFLKLAIITGKRKGLLAAMRWDEIDDASIWTPADAVEPMKVRGKTRNKRAHAIPLPALAQRVLTGLTRVDGNPYVFVGRHSGKHLDPGSALQQKVKKKSGIDDFYWHALRHTAETEMGTLQILPFVRDAILDHAPARGSGKVYDQNLYLVEMSEGLEMWANRIEEIVMPKGVRALR